jgi:hypothetical protein
MVGNASSVLVVDGRYCVFVRAICIAYTVEEVWMFEWHEHHLRKT